ncbi:MAG: DUF2764 domain-containing protein [Paludibacteraceae bacterium]|nr:DUF2764 domain-containing protein [Paludibacteraceae bacterium]
MGYECLIAGLPELRAGGEAPLKMEALLTLLDETLTDKDKAQLSLLRMTSDDEIITDMLTRYDDSIIGQPAWWEEIREVLSETDLRTQLLYEYGIKHGSRFVRDWFKYNQDMCNVLVATICRKHGFDVRRMIVGQNEVAQILRKNLPQKDFGLGGVMDNLQEVMSIVEIDNLMEREKRMDAIRFMWLEDATRFINFSAENVLAYYLQSEMLNRWGLLTVEEGEKVFRALVADMKKGINI